MSRLIHSSLLTLLELLTFSMVSVLKISCSCSFSFGATASVAVPHSVLEGVFPLSFSPLSSLSFFLSFPFSSLSHHTRSKSYLSFSSPSHYNLSTYGHTIHLGFHPQSHALYFFFCCFSSYPDIIPFIYYDALSNHCNNVQTLVNRSKHFWNQGHKRETMGKRAINAGLMHPKHSKISASKCLKW